MKKFLGMLVAVAMMAPAAYAADAITEEEGATAIDLYLAAELMESLKVIISNDDMVVDALPNTGYIHLDGGVAANDKLIDVVATRANTACYSGDGVAASTAIVYADAGNSCAYDTANGAAGQAIFEVAYRYEVELSGTGTITLDMHLNDVPAMGVNFEDSAISSADAEAVANAGADLSIVGLEHAAAGTIEWTGKAPFNMGPQFEDNIAVDVVLVP